MMWVLLDATSATAQTPAPSASAAAAAQPQVQSQPPPAPPAEPKPTPETLQPAEQKGQWGNTTDSGWIWVPADTTTYDVEGVPYVYIYTPAYGWTWYASPWGWGAFVIGPWVYNPWPFGFRAWGYGVGGWGWRGGTTTPLSASAIQKIAKQPHAKLEGLGCGEGERPL